MSLTIIRKCYYDLKNPGYGYQLEEIHKNRKYFYINPFISEKGFSFIKYSLNLSV